MIPMSFSSSSRTFFISEPSTRANPQLVTRTGGMLMTSSSPDDGLFFLLLADVVRGRLKGVDVSSTLPTSAANASANKASSSNSSNGAASVDDVKRASTRAVTTCVDGTVRRVLTQPHRKSEKEEPQNRHQNLITLKEFP